MEHGVVLEIKGLHYLVSDKCQDNFIDGTRKCEPSLLLKKKYILVDSLGLHLF